MKRRISTSIGGLLVLSLATLAFRPVPIPQEKNCLVVRGIVIEVYEAGTKDVVFRLQADDRTFYVNRGLKRGLDLQKLKAQLINTEITIKYPKYWTPLDPGNSMRHVSKIEAAGQTIFSEID